MNLKNFRLELENENLSDKIIEGKLILLENTVLYFSLNLFDTSGSYLEKNKEIYKKLNSFLEKFEFKFYNSYTRKGILPFISYLYSLKIIKEIKNSLYVYGLPLYGCFSADEKKQKTTKSNILLKHNDYFFKEEEYFESIKKDENYLNEIVKNKDFLIFLDEDKNIKIVKMKKMLSEYNEGFLIMSIKNYLNKNKNHKFLK
jgi:hypothetical protein